MPMSIASQQIDQILNQAYLKLYPLEYVRDIEVLGKDQILEILTHIPTDEVVAVWERLSPAVASELVSSLDPKLLKKILIYMDPNRAALLLLSLNENERLKIVDSLASDTRKELERALSYTPNSAGALMGTRLVYFTPDMTVEQALEKLRARKRPAVRSLYIVDDKSVLQGMVDMQDLALADPKTSLAEISQKPPAYAELITTREEVVDIFEKYRVTELPVVDINGCLQGVVRHRTLISVAKEQGSIDIQTMVGVSKDERALSKASFAIRKRLPWLQVNLATAFLAAFVVGIFEQTIAQVTALAVLLPVVAGQSGNTGAQAMAVTLRGVALREVWPRDWLKIIIKEASVGFWNGIAVALTTALGVYVWSRSIGLCLIIGVSMIISMIIASVSGAAIPLILVKVGQDPATSSSIFLTTVTDVMGFLSFLGIATLFMSYI